MEGGIDSRWRDDGWIVGEMTGAWMMEVGREGWWMEEWRDNGRRGGG